ncbi:MAG: hypothetical protein ACOCWO_02515 [Candidatus Muiribacteriaceae bacterium]
MNNKISLIISHIEKLHSCVQRLVQLSEQKKKLVCERYKVESLLRIMSSEDLESKSLAKFQERITHEMSELPLINDKELNLSVFSDYLEKRGDSLCDKVRDLKELINNKIQVYRENTVFCNMILETESTYYRHILKAIDKSHTYGDGRRQKINLFNASA